jgi:TolB protein
MRLKALAGLVVAFAIGAAAAAHADPPAPAAAATPDKQVLDLDALLGNVMVEAGGAGRVLPKVAIYPSLASDSEDVTLRSVMTRDLDLCGEFEVLPDKDAPQALYLDDSPIDAAAWAAKGVMALVRVRGKKLNDKQAVLRAQAFLVKKGPDAVFDKKFAVPAESIREESHRLADVVIGALTGQNGGFASHMTFASGSGGLRRIFTIDADGHDAKAVSPSGTTAIAPAFGKNTDLYYASSKSEEPYVLIGPQGPIALPVKGSVYGIAFSKDKSKVALSLGVGNTIRVFSGPDFAHVTEASPVGMALHPAFTPSGKLGFVGEGKFGQRVYVDGKPITPDGIYASSPTFCNNPDGVRTIFAVGVGKNLDLVSTGETGGGLGRLTQGQARNSYPACSPDGRLVAFFSTRTSGEGPGLYIMRIDGFRPKRISNLLGDSLRWDPLPPGKGVETKN